VIYALYKKSTLPSRQSALYIDPRARELFLISQKKLESPPASQALSDEKLSLGRRARIDKKTKTHI